MRKDRRQNTEHRRNLTPPSPPLKLRGGWGALSLSHLSKEGLLSNKGGTLVELMITLVIFTIVISMIYSVFNALIKQATSERKTAKTEMDVINVVWPLLKEIQTAGFGVPKTVTPISELGGELTIRSTAAGDSQYAGGWSYVTGTTKGAVGPGVPTGKNVVIINTDKSRIGLDTVSADAAGGGYYYLAVTATDSNVAYVAYWTPYDSEVAGPLEYYETKYSLTAYDPASSKPAMCAPDGGATEKVLKLSRKSSKTTAGANYQPILDCVLDLAYRFGCINTSTGNLTWQAGTDCGTSKLRLVKVGMIVQNSTRRDFHVPSPITLFEDLSGQSKSVTLSSEQRYYKWRKVEQTIILKNLE